MLIVVHTRIYKLGVGFCPAGASFVGARWNPVTTKLLAHPGRG